MRLQEKALFYEPASSVHEQPFFIHEWGMSEARFGLSPPLTTRREKDKRLLRTYH
ncbi:MAG: hypothetical protein LBN11_06890 [Tannerella sp.]|jgi:hypothetical protein|nr:hypothetical protein [Tannerella sp.]